MTPNLTAFTNLQVYGLSWEELFKLMTWKNLHSKHRSKCSSCFMGYKFIASVSNNSYTSYCDVNDATL